MDVVISKSKNSSKKFDATINCKKKISFGDSNYSDFTKHKDTDRKEAYITGHSKEDWSKSNIASPAWVGRFILWENQHLKVLLIALIKNVKVLDLF